MGIPKDREPMTATYFRRQMNLREVLDVAEFRPVRYVINRHGKPCVAIVSFGDLEILENIEKYDLVGSVQKAIEKRKSERDRG